MEDAERLIRSLRREGIVDETVLGAMTGVPRDRFVPPESRNQAWEDHPLPIGDGQTISQPFIVAYMTQSLDLHPGDNVLDVGTGSGYQAAILAACGCRVHSIEVRAELADRARRTLDELGYAVTVATGDGALGWPDAAPFDGIVVAAAAGDIPPALLEQLRPPDPQHRGGRLILPLDRAGDLWSAQRLILVERMESGYRSEELLAVRFVPLIPGDDRRATN